MQRPDAARRHGGPLAAVAVVLAIGGPVAAQQFFDRTSSLFPTPNPSEWTNQLTIGDLDGDGALDIVFANGGNFSSAGTPQTQRVYINGGGGAFTDESAARLGFSGLCRGVELGDIDADGDLDMIFVQDFQRLPALFRNDGAGNFTNITATHLPSITLSSSRAQFGDIDNDGDLDLYITNGATNRFGCGQYMVYVNDGTGVFTDETAARHPIGSFCENMDCIFGDIDNDYDLDVMTAGTGTNNSRLFVNDGTGVFTQGAFPGDTTCYSYDFGDVDGDGFIDLLGANGLTGSSSEILLINNGNGTFTNASSQISPNPSQDDNDSKFLDYDDDGDLDLLIARLGSGGEKLYANDGNGNFTQTSGVVEVISDSSLDLVVADLNGNGRFEFVTAQGESGSFQNRIYANVGPADTHPPVVVSTERQLDTADRVGPYVIRALILDSMTSDRNFFDRGIELHYTRDGGPDQVVPMRHSGGQVYRGEIPGQTLGGLIEYSVTARDFANNVGTGATLDFFVDRLGDVDGDTFTDVTDLLAVLGAWGPCPATCPEDTNGDDVVNVTDLLNVLAGWS
jgi:hypothetical protein